MEPVATTKIVNKSNGELSFFCDETSSRLETSIMNMWALPHLGVYSKETYIINEIKGYIGLELTYDATTKNYIHPEFKLPPDYLETILKIAGQTIKPNCKNEGQYKAFQKAKPNLVGFQPGLSPKLLVELIISNNKTIELEKEGLLQALGIKLKGFKDFAEFNVVMHPLSHKKYKNEMIKGRIVEYAGSCVLSLKSLNEVMEHDNENLKMCINTPWFEYLSMHMKSGATCFSPNNNKVYINDSGALSLCTIYTLDESKLRHRVSIHLIINDYQQEVAGLLSKSINVNEILIGLKTLFPKSSILSVIENCFNISKQCSKQHAFLNNNLLLIMESNNKICLDLMNLIKLNKYF